MATRLTVLGGGPGGYVAAVRAAQLGAEVTLIENDALGGTCLNWGCIPSKILKATADRLHDTSRFAGFGIDLGGPPVLNLGALNARKEKVIAAQVKGISHLLAHHGITHINGTGRVEGPGRVVVDGPEASGVSVPWDRLVIATGSAPTSLPGLDLDGNRIISSNEALYLETLPQSMVIVGGGVIGCEFASIFDAFGVEVTVVEALDRLLPLPSVDADVSKVMAREMKKRKIKFHVSRVVEGVETGEDSFAVTIGPSPFSSAGGSTGASAQVIPTEVVLVCVGRSPNTVGLGLEIIGVETDDRGWIRADENMRTTAEHVYAIGDVLGPSKVMLAHVASAEGMAAVENAMGGDRAMDYRAVPGAIFTSPEVATVGLTEAEAAEEGIDARADTVQFRTVGKAQVIDEIAGMVKMISERNTGKILGVHMIGPHVTDLIAEGTLAIQTGCTVEQLVDTIHAHPTLAEVMLETGLKALDRSLHG
jgi:dihydrolipoamide dehydrogenase